MKQKKKNLLKDDIHITVPVNFVLLQKAETKIKEFLLWSTIFAVSPTYSQSINH